MKLTRKIMFSRSAFRVAGKSNAFLGWLILWLLLGFGMASPGQCGLVERLTSGLTDPGAIEARCRKGEASLCTSAGNMYRRGYKVTKDIDKAIEFYLLGCSGGDTNSCYALYQIGFDYSRGRKVKTDMPKAVKLFTAACEGSASGRYSGPACDELGKLYLEGKSVPKDISRGVELLHRGCDRSNSRSCRDLGNVLLDGRLVSRDVPGAVAAYRRACSGKYKEHTACMKMGMLFIKGEEVERDIAEAERYLTEACTFPDRIGTACYELAHLYETDLTGRKPEEAVTELYRVACDRAESDRMGSACVAAAERYLQGRGVKKDPNTVIHLYNRGCMLKDHQSCRRSCEWNCKNGQPQACAAIKSDRIPLGVMNCFKL